MLEKIFGSRTRVKLLKLFLTHPEQSFFVRELMRTTGEKLNSIRRELDHLEELGLVKVVVLKDKEDNNNKTQKQKKKYYKVNPDFILYNEFKNLILKSGLLLERSLANEINKLGKVKLLVLSGVFVDDQKSKTDLLAVGNIDRRKLESLIKKLEKNFDQKIRYTLMSNQEFNYRNDVTDKFLFEILEGKKVVIVDEIS